MFASMNNCIIIVLVLPQDPSYQFKDIKQLIMGMLETYNYEEVNYSSLGTDEVRAFLYH